jgi:hypothetical protein
MSVHSTFVHLCQVCRVHTMARAGGEAIKQRTIDEGRGSVDPVRAQILLASRPLHPRLGAFAAVNGEYSVW